MMDNSTLKENKGLFIVIGVSIVLLIIAFFLPVPSVYNDFVTKLGSLVTIVGATASYLAWSNTQKLIERRKLSELKVSDEDIIVGVECLRTKTDIEGSILKSSNNELPELKKLVKGTGITIEGDHELGIPGSYFDMKISSRINRGIIITSKKMPTDDAKDTDKYIDDYRVILQRLYEMLSKTDCKTVHLFFAAPVALSPFVMPYFVNKMKVIAYHYDYDNQKYIKLGLIDGR